MRVAGLGILITFGCGIAGADQPEGASLQNDEETLIIHEDYWAIEERDPPYTVGEVKARYGEPDQIVTNEYSMEMVYSSLGLEFSCHSPEDATDGIREMTVSSPFRLRTVEGIALGKSTVQEAAEAYGKLAWYGRGDMPGYSFFRHHDVRFLVSRPKGPIDEEARLKRKIDRMILFYSALKRLDYVEPAPVVIKADATALSEAPDSIEGYLNQVFIERLDLDLDAIKDPDWEPIWDNFVNRPYEKQFTSMSNENWFEKRQRFEAELLKRAREGKYDEVGLQRILDSIRPAPDDRTAWIPVCAFRARKGDEPVWIIVTKWEHAGKAQLTRLKEGWKELDSGSGDELFEPDGDPVWSSLGHIRVEVFRVSDGELVDATQCG